MEINRRNFLKIGMTLGLATAFAPFNKLFSAANKAIRPKKSTAYPDLIAVKDGSPAQMFELGIKALGGMKRFVKKGQTVLVKPNIGWNKTPLEGANTNPDLVGKIVKMAYQSGAKKVVVFDNTCNEMEDCYKNSGIQKAVTDNKGEMHPGDEEKYYKDVSIKGAKILKTAKVHKTYLDADVIINVPVLKQHRGSRMTSAIKNLMGVVWDRRYWHRKGLHECIADFPLLTKKVDLTVIDAYTVMMKNGPMGVSPDDLVRKKMQIISTDMVLADSAAAKLLKMNPNDINYLKLGQAFGYGTMDLKNSKIKKISCKS